ncbi:MAG: molecular chaperone, partial [Terracidiphilus sp.]
MEWCLNCHRNPAKNLRPTSEIYNMAWEAPAEDRPVWCAELEQKTGVPTAQSASCTTSDPTGGGPEMAALQLPAASLPAASASGVDSDTGSATLPATASYKKFTSQDELGHFLLDHYNIRTPKELTSCEVCHR